MTWGEWATLCTRLTTSLNNSDCICVANICKPIYWSTCLSVHDIHVCVFFKEQLLFWPSPRCFFHPIPLFCALAEVIPALFNPTSLILITFHLLHSAYCPTAPVSLFYAFHTPQPYWSRPTCSTVLPNTSMTLTLMRQLHSGSQPSIIKAQPGLHETSQFNHHPLSSHLSSQAERNPLRITIGLAVMASSCPMQLQCSPLHYI